MKVNTIKKFSGLNRYESWASSWSKKEDVDIFSYLSMVCNPEDCLLFCRLLFPDFHVEDGAVILSAKYERDAYIMWLDKFDGDVCSVERIMNNTHLYDVFSGCLDGVDDVVFLQLAEVVAFSWRLVLKEKFPEYRFSVGLSNTDQDYGPTITFFQILD